MALLTALAGLLVFSHRLAAPSPWRDEAVTVAVVRRSAAQIADLVREVDLVHAPYYFLAHALLGRDADVVDVRRISVVAAALTAAALCGTARRAVLASPGGVGPGAARLAGLTAALVWVATPFASRYAQEARPYALAALLVTVSTYCLLRRWWAAYALTLLLLTAVNSTALLVLLAHAGWTLASPGTRRRAALAAAAGLALSAPLLLAQSRQRGQVAFLQPPAPADLLGHATFALGGTAGALLAAAVAVAACVLARARRAVLLGVLWGVAWVPLLWLVSQVQPLWTTRYLVPVAPGTCLLLATVVTAGWGATRSARSARGARVLPAAGLAAGLVAGTAVAGWHMQVVFRDSAIGHGEDLRGTAELIAEGARPGDGLLFVPDGEYRYRVVTQLYPEAFAGLEDLALAEPAATSGTLVGVPREPAEVARALAGVDRVWVVGGPGELLAATPADAATVVALQGWEVVQEADRRAFSVRLVEPAATPEPVTTTPSP
ncbi:hypothetical protein [Kineococcus terrestris]|uniref:hypothetical protein n=1 Tax=Kineococcus terrestris TaxID=2044856 RepID=UPI0034DABFE9